MQPSLNNQYVSPPSMNAPSVRTDPSPSVGSLTEKTLHLAELAYHYRTRSVIDTYNARPLLLAFEVCARAFQSNATVLDIGCGTGEVTRALSAAGFAASGIDIDPSRISTARASSADFDIDYAVADAAALPFPDESFDLTLSLSVLQYVDWRKAIRECKRILKPGGRALFIENLYAHPLAKAYRLARRVAWGYDHNLTPRQHISWKDRSEFERVFSSVTCHAHHVLTPILLLPNAFRRRRASAFSRPGSALFGALNTIDDRLLRNWPAFEGYAWLGTFLCTN